MSDTGHQMPTGMRNVRLEDTDLDEIDLKILGILEEDARTPYSTLAEMVGLSRVSVKERVNELKRRGVIERFTIQIPAKHIGKPLPVFFDLKFQPELLEAAALVITDHPDIVIVYQMSGINALHVHGFFKDIDEVSTFVNSFVSKIPGVQAIASEFLFKRYKADRMLLV
ncbi:MAG TPA: Lrp/AsnC family transcriptional regulator [Rectinemataceae bacterium]|nr:Lrp/AsnC family transcriptional regulator [Rectinemataceae bacterium]